jgi:aryl-alcohol dehydrogenase-like predicted oxidoreductase
VNQTAKQLGVTPAQVAIAWLADKPSVTAPIVGTRTAERPATSLDGIDTLVDDRDTVRLLPEVGRALRRAVLALRSRGLPR